MFPTPRSIRMSFPNGSDVQLFFDVGQETQEAVPAHSCVLNLWSGVLAGALKTAHKENSNKSGDRSSEATGNVHTLTVPMPGTSK